MSHLALSGYTPSGYRREPREQGNSSENREARHKGSYSLGEALLIVGIALLSQLVEGTTELDDEQGHHAVDNTWAGGRVHGRGAW